MKRVIVIGVDGATWSLLEPMMKKGLLPNLQAVIRRGVMANLESTIPPLTAAAWGSFASGKSPAKTGIFDFILPGSSIDQYRIATAGDLHTKLLHEFLDEQGCECVIVNLPFSLPTKTRRCIILPSFLDAADDFPRKSELQKSIPLLNQYSVFPDPALLSNPKAYLEEVRRIENVRFKCSQNLFKSTKWKFFFLLFSGTDWAQHRFFEKMCTFKLEVDHPAIQIFKDVDNYIGWFVNNLPLDCQLMIISDHGFRTFTKVLYINEFLHQHGWLQIRPYGQSKKSYLKHQESSVSSIPKQKISIRLPNRLLDLMNIPFLARILRRFNFLRFQFQTARGTVTSNSVAFAPTNSSIFINRMDYYNGGLVSKQDYPKTLNQIYQSLQKLRDPQTNTRVIQHIIKPAEVLSSIQKDVRLPDLIIFSDTYMISRELSGRIFQEQKMDNHSQTGIFIAYGSKIQTNKEISTKSILDLYPTILYMLGYPIPDDLDGKIITEIFENIT